MPVAVQGGTSTDGPAYITADGAANYFGWCATARDASSTEGARGSKIDIATRTSITPFMVGLKENVLLETSTGRCWKWRRVCFTIKGAEFVQDFSPSTSNWFREDSKGWRRLLTPVPSGGELDLLTNIMFRGTFGDDWTDPFVAQLDPRRITIKYDKFRTIRSGNEQGVSRRVPLWHSMRKNLYYRDDEDGGTTEDLVTSVDSRAGMGDYFVIDIIRSVGTAGSDQMTFEPQATLYWHEK